MASAGAALDLSAGPTTGERLRRLRRSRGLEQGDVAAWLKAHGVKAGNTMISRWENDQRRPSVAQMMLLADLYGVKVVDLGATPTELAMARALQEAASRVKPPGIDPRLSLVARTGDALPIGY